MTSSSLSAWTHSTWTDAGQLATLIAPRHANDEARGKAPHAWFATLRERGALADAATFAAHAMPRYECVVWATRSLIETGLIARDDPGMIAALRWIDDPCDRLRRAAADHAASADDEAPSSLLCQAVFVSGGSISLEDLPQVQPPPDSCARLAAAAVLTAAFAAADPATVLEHALALAQAMLSGTQDGRRA